MKKLVIILFVVAFALFVFYSSNFSTDIPTDLSSIKLPVFYSDTFLVENGFQFDGEYEDGWFCMRKYDKFKIGMSEKVFSDSLELLLC